MPQAYSSGQCMHLQHGNNLDLGINTATGEHVTLSREKRATHLYVCGSTGTGKSKFLEHLIRQDIMSWRQSKSGLLLIDPHGSLYDSLMEWMAFHRLSRPVVPIDLRSDEWIVAYNMLRDRPGADPAVVVSNFVQAMAYVWGQTGTNETPLFARWAGNILRTLYETKQTLVQAEHLIDHLATDVRRALVKNMKTQSVLRDWRYADQLKPSEFEAQVGSTVNRLRRFLGTDMLRSMFGQPEVSLDLGKALDEGQIILVNLASRGSRVSEEDASLFATLLLSDLWAAAKERGKGDARKPVKPFYTYIDEFQNFVTPSIAQGLDQARGFGLHLTLAHQYPNQLLNAGPHGKAIYDSVMVNARSKAIFQVEGEENLKPLASALFMGVINPDEIKHRLYSTKVIGYRKEARQSITRSSAVNESSSDGTGAMRLTDGDTGDTVSRFSSSSRGRSSGYSETETEIDAPVLGPELSSVQFRNLEEQKFRAMATLFAQEQRACVVRLVGERLPMPVSVPNVESFHLKTERVRQYAEKLSKQWLFLLPVAEAKAGLQLREDTISRMIAIPDGEPKTARRKL
jgi:hypothetical protein